MWELGGENAVIYLFDELEKEITSSLGAHVWLQGLGIFNENPPYTAMNSRQRNYCDSDFECRFSSVYR